MCAANFTSIHMKLPWGLAALSWDYIILITRAPMETNLSGSGSLILRHHFFKRGRKDGFQSLIHWYEALYFTPNMAVKGYITNFGSGIVGPRPSFGEPWSCLTIFGTSTGWSKMERPGEAEIAGSRPLLWDFWGLGFM
jgi:hypothetical protein